MKKKHTFLSRGLFEKDFLQSRIHTYSMTFKEKALGYALGPGIVLVYTTLVQSLREMFYVSVVPLDSLFGKGTYMRLQTTTSILGILMGLLVAYMAERTVSRAGRIRPYVLMGTLLMAISGVGMFWSPFQNGEIGQLVWLYIINIIYMVVGTSMFNLRYQALALSTRNVQDRNQVTTLRTAIDSMMPGLFGAIIVTGWLYYVFLANDMTGNNWRLFILIPALIAIPGAFIEYFYTRERITEDNRQMNYGKEDHETHVIPFVKQVKSLLTNKYYVMTVILACTLVFISYLQGANARTYFCQWILGANDQNGLAVIYLMISMQPMAIGMVVAPILAKRWGVRKITMVSCVLTLAGLAVCMINPYNFGLACGGGLLFGVGMVAVSYMSKTFDQHAADYVEYKCGFRPEGTVAVAVIGAVYAIILSPMSALYETVLVESGFDAFSTTGQVAAVNNWIIFAYYGAYAINAVVMLVVLIFFNIEKQLPQIHAELKERRKQAVLARGEEWIDPEEEERLQGEEAKRNKTARSSK